MGTLGLTDAKKYMTSIALKFNEKASIQSFNSDPNYDNWAQTRNSLERNVQRELEKRIGYSSPNMIIPNFATGTPSIVVTDANDATKVNVSVGQAFIRGSLCEIPSGTVFTMTTTDGDYYLCLHLLNARSDESFELVDILVSNWSGTSNKENYLRLAKVTVAGTGTEVSSVKNMVGQVGQPRIWNVIKEMDYSGTIKDHVYYQIEENMVILKAELRVWMRKVHTHVHSLIGVNTDLKVIEEHRHKIPVKPGGDPSTGDRLEVSDWINYEWGAGEEVRDIVYGGGIKRYLKHEDEFYSTPAGHFHTMSSGNTKEHSGFAEHSQSIHAIDIEEDGGALASNVGSGASEGDQPTGSPWSLSNLTSGSHYISVKVNGSDSSQIGRCQVTIRFIGLIV